jgi:hypothetical protein
MILANFAGEMGRTTAIRTSNMTFATPPAQGSNGQKPSIMNRLHQNVADSAATCIYPWRTQDPAVCISLFAGQQSGTLSAGKSANPVSMLRAQEAAVHS